MFISVEALKIWELFSPSKDKKASKEMRNTFIMRFTLELFLKSRVTAFLFKRVCIITSDVDLQEGI